MTSDMLQEGVDLERRRFIVCGEVGERMLQRIIIGLETLEALNHDPLTIILSSSGGEFKDGLGIYDRIQQSPCKITIEAIGSCQSMATIILQAADVRLISKNLRFMIHRGTVEFSGESKAVWRECHFDKFVDEPLAESIYLAKIKAKNKGFKKKQLDELLSTDSYLLPETVISLNLADGYINK